MFDFFNILMFYKSFPLPLLQQQFILPLLQMTHQRRFYRYYLRFTQNWSQFSIVAYSEQFQVCSHVLICFASLHQLQKQYHFDSYIQKQHQSITMNYELTLALSQILSFRSTALSLFDSKQVHPRSLPFRADLLVGALLILVLLLDWDPNLMPFLLLHLLGSQLLGKVVDILAHDLDSWR